MDLGSADAGPWVSTAGTSTGALDEPPPVAWEIDGARARGRARDEDRLLLVYLRADWEAASLAMERDGWGDRDVRAAMRSVVALRVDLSAAGPSQDLALSLYQNPQIPAVIVYSARGRELMRREGLLEPPELRAFCAQMLSPPASRRSAPR